MFSRPSGKITRTTHPTLAVVRGLILVAALMTLLSVGVTVAQDDTPTVGRVRVDGTITPVMATYIGRAIDRAADHGDSAVILEMDTPGGLSSAMDDIISDILASEIPVIVWVAPNGARAASAGAYIAYAAHVSAMAPATNIGSATPVQLGEQDDDGSETAMDRKVVNDAVAKIRALAEMRDRNADWAEDAVRDAVNVSATEAVRLNVVDFIAKDEIELLEQADGREVTVGVETVTVNVAGATIRSIEMSFFERLLQVITDPNIAFVFVSLGTLALIFELANPGSIGPGAVGGLMLVTGFYALGTLDTNWAGLALMGLAILLFAIDVFVTSHGILTITGIVAFLFGALLLSNTRNDDVLAISRTVIFTITLLFAAFFLFIARSAWRSRDFPVVTGDAQLVGHVGSARTDLTPEGMVYLLGELWQATATQGGIPKGEHVRVVRKEGLRLVVEPVPHDGSLPPPGMG
jgi:membrane-bound serine protease (ClpP class)